MYYRYIKLYLMKKLQKHNIITKTLTEIKWKIKDKDH